MKEIKFRARCQECKKSRYVIDHHIITNPMVKYLIEVGRYKRGDIISLRNQLKVRLCKECEHKFHNKFGKETLSKIAVLTDDGRKEI